MDPRLIDEAQDHAPVRDVASDQQNHGLEADLTIDRDTASRLGIPPQSIDNTLYDAFGQRQVSTIFTQLESVPRDTGGRARVLSRIRPTLDDIYVRLDRRGAGAAERLHHVSSKPRPRWSINHQGQFPASRSRSTWAAGTRSAMRLTRSSRPRAAIGLPASDPGRLPGNRAGVPGSLANEPILILAALVTVYIVLGVLYESYIHPITILSTLPSAGVGALLALMICRDGPQRDRADRDHSADRNRQEECDHDDRFRARGANAKKARLRARRSTRPACCASGRS